jgi:hypothetical protein
MQSRNAAVQDDQNAPDDLITYISSVTNASHNYMMTAVAYHMGSGMLIIKH